MKCRGFGGGPDERPRESMEESDGWIEKKSNDLAYFMDNMGCIILPSR